jgi:hypothetical protein
MDDIMGLRKNFVYSSITGFSRLFMLRKSEPAKQD